MAAALLGVCSAVASGLGSRPRTRKRVKSWAVLGVQEAVVADFDEALGQDMLQEAGQELQSR